MSITAPCIIVFGEYPESVFPAIFGENMSFKILQIDNYTSSSNLMTSFVSLSMLEYEIYYSSNGQDYTQVYVGGYWENPKYRAIYVENWGTFDTSELETFASNPNNAVIWPADVAYLSVVFHDEIIRHRVFGYVLFNSNNQNFDYMDQTSAGNVRYYLEDSDNSITTYQDSTGVWSNNSYQTVNFGGWEQSKKDAFCLWVALNSDPRILPTYQVGWRYNGHS